MQITWQLAEKISSIVWRDLLRPKVFFLVLMWFIGIGGNASAMDPSDLYAGVAPFPLADSPFRLTSQVLDAVLYEIEGDVWVSVSSTFRLENTDSSVSQSVTLTLPVELTDGYVFDPGALTDFEMLVNGANRDLTALRSVPHGLPEEDIIAYTVDMDVSAGQISIVEISYRQNLGSTPKIAFHFATSTASRWAGPIGSSKITVEFPRPTTREQILDVGPAYSTFDGQRLIWYEDNLEPRDDTFVVFVEPALWQQINYLRAQTTNVPELFDNHYQLANLYGQLVSTDSAICTSQHFRDLMLAELETITSNLSGAPLSLLCGIHDDLARFYLDCVQLPDGQLDASYLTYAVQEFEHMQQTCPKDNFAPVLMRRMKDAYLYLAREARERGAYPICLNYLEMGSLLYDSTGPGDDDFLRKIEEEKRQCFLIWVRTLLQQGEIENAIEVAKRGNISDEAFEEWRSVPRLGAVQMSIQTDSSNRRILLSLAPHPLSVRDEILQDTVGTIVDTLAQSSALQVTTVPSDAGVYLIQVMIPFNSSDELLQAQASLIQFLPDWPEFSFVKDAMQPVEWRIVRQDSWLADQLIYKEIVNTSESESVFTANIQRCVDELTILDSDHSSYDAADSSSESTLIRGEILLIAQNGWKNLLENSRAVFSTDWTLLTGQYAMRTWTVGVGEVLDMQLESQTYKLSSLVGIVVLVFLILAIVVLLVLLMAGLEQ